MKIVYFITRSDTIGGAQIHVRDLSLKMIQSGHEVIVILGGNGMYADHLKKLNIKVVSLHKLYRTINFFCDIKSIIELWQITGKINPDIISLHSVKAGLLGRIVAFSKRIPSIFTAHGWSHIRVAGKVGSIFYSMIEKILILISAHLVTVCKNDFDFAINNLKLPYLKVSTIYNGIPTLLSEHNPKKQNILPVLVSVARFQEPKDFDTLVNSLSLIRNLEWKFRFVGDGPMLCEVKKAVDELQLSEKISFAGALNHVDRELSVADIFVLISKSEGFPRSILEAMRAGLPVVATNVGGISESVNDGVNGYLVENGNHMELASKLAQLINSKDQRKHLGENSKKLFNNNFTFDHMFYQTFELYKRVISNYR